MTTQKTIIHEFTSDEIAEINRYVTNNVPYSELPKLYVLSQNVEDKSLVFISIFRIMVGVRTYLASKSESHTKVDKLLNEGLSCFGKILEAYNNHKKCNLEAYKHRHYKRLFDLVHVPEHQEIMHKFQDFFLVFVDKQIVTPMDNIAGIDMNAEKGPDLIKELRNAAQSQ